jgi:putative transposase
MIYGFIAEHHDRHRVGMMASTFKVTRSGYYAWKSKGTSTRQAYDQKLVEQILTVQGEVRHSYGSPRMTNELKDRGISAGHNRIARLMKKHGIGALRRKKFRITTRSKDDQVNSKNLLNRHFTAKAKNEAWVSDITYVLTAEGWLYLCTVLDLYSRRLVGWAMDNRLEAQLAIDALQMAIVTRRPSQGLLFHSDRGCQYASKKFRAVLKKHGIRQSMSRRGNCWDNACAESFFSSLKLELSYDYVYRTRSEARSEIFDYIEVFYNRKRLHSTLGYMSPERFEQREFQRVS